MTRLRDSVRVYCITEIIEPYWCIMCVTSAGLHRLHKKCVEAARRRLEEHQHTLKLRHTIGSTSVPLALTPDVLHAGEPPASQLPSRPAPSQVRTAEITSTAIVLSIVITIIIRVGHMSKTLYE